MFDFRSILGLTGDAPEDERRNRAIRRAVFTSVLSKAGGALLQLVSIPIAIRVLGLEMFGIYSTVTIAIALIILLQIGVGPALTHGISRAVASGDRELEKNYYTTSLFLILGFVFAAFTVVASILSNVPITTLFGQDYARFADEMTPALWLGAIILLIEFALTHTERTREGYMETNINNAWGAAGNVLGALSLGIGIFFFPTIEFLLLTVYGSNVVAKIGNTIHLLSKRPYLLPRFSRYHAKIRRVLISDGIAFFFSGSISALVEVNAVALILAHVLGPPAIAIFNILLQISTILTGIILMFTTPTWPAIVDAFARNEFAWIHLTAKRLRRFAYFYTCAAGAALVLLGPWLIPLWLGDEVQITRSVYLAFAFFFFVDIRNHVNHSLLVGVGKVKEAAVYILIEAAIILGPALTGLLLFGLPGLLWGMFLTKAMITGIVFPRMFASTMSAHSPHPSKSPTLSEPTPAHAP